LQSNTLETLTRAHMGEQAFSIERIHFVKTDRRHNPKKVTPYKYFPGTLPVLVSAPHAVRHIRHKKIKPSDEFTGSMAYLLNQITSCHSLAITKLYGGDPNFDTQCIYKDFISRLTAEHRLKLIIDLHGASRTHGFAIDIGTMNGVSLLDQNRYRDILKKSLLNYDITPISENKYTISGNKTITAHASENLGIPALQLEINKKYRSPNQNAADYCRIMAALVDFINAVINEQ